MSGKRLRFVLPFLATAIAIFLLAASASAQGNGFHGGASVAARGVPASVTSFGFGGHPGFHGVPASVTSQGFGSNSAFRGAPPSVSSFGFGAEHGIRRGPSEFRRHRRDGFRRPFYGGYYGYVPYAYPYYYGDYPAEDDYVDDAGYNAPPTREYDDRAVLNDDYRSEMNAPRPQEVQPAPESVADQPNTVLIFKDGHQVEIANYAIVGSTLYDLSEGRSKKVQLADLDVAATVKENDDRGVEFQLPAAMKAN